MSVRTYLIERLIPNGLKINEHRFQSSQEKQETVILEFVKLEELEFEGKLKILQKNFKKNMFVLRAKYPQEFHDRIMSKVEKSNRNYEKKFGEVKRSKLVKLRVASKDKEETEPEEFAGDFFANIVEKSKRKRRKKNISKEKLIDLKRKKLIKWKNKMKEKYHAKKKENHENEASEVVDPLGLFEESQEDWVNQFFQGIESSKVKNLSDDPMPESIKAFLSLGTKFTPVSLDIDREQLEKDLESWFRRLRLKYEFNDEEDQRSEEEKRFYLKRNWTPPTGKSPHLDMFIYKIRQKFNNWIHPSRIKDNMTAIEREGEKLIKRDSIDHVYKREDKGSCIVRMNKADYERNVENNLNNQSQYEVILNDTSKDTEEKVCEYVDKIVSIGHMKENTAEYVKSKTKETKPGAYYEQPKTHKFDEDNHKMSEGFPARGIISCNKTPTEALQDFIDFKTNPAMKSLPSFMKDTKHFIQIVEEVEEVTDDVSIVTADIDNMYMKMPLELSEQGIREYFDKQNSDGNEMNTDEIIEGLELCQDNNIFEFKEKLYKQKIGHATGQKQAPPVACRGAGIVERKFLNLPRDIVSDSSPHILSKPKQDPVFWSVKDLTAFWGRFIDDVFSLFRGNREQAEWYFQKLSSLYPGQVNFTWEFSETGAISLNVEVFLNKEKEIFETKYYFKPSNKRLFLNYRSNHPNHTFGSIVYSQALQGVMNGRMEFRIFTRVA